MNAKTVSGVRRPSENEIAEAAYHIWLKEGRPDGRAAIHWTEAERQLLADFLQESVRAKSPKTIAKAISQALAEAHEQTRATRSAANPQR